MSAFTFSEIDFANFMRPPLVQLVRYSLPVIAGDVPKLGFV